MKGLKVLSVLVVVAVFLVLAYTRGYIANSATYLNAEADSVVIGKKGGTIKIAIDTDARRWTVKRKPEWLKAKRDGDTLIVDFGHTIGKTNIIDTITLEAANQTLSLPVKQYARATMLRFAQDTLYFKQSGGSQMVGFETDGEKLKIMPDQFADVTLADGTITLKVAANESYAERISYITLHSDQLVRRLYYRQPGTGVRQQVVRKVNIEPCSECGGLGKLLTEVDIMTGDRIYKTCPVCHGTGRK